MAKVLQEVRRAERGTLHDVFCRVRSGKQTRMDGDLLMSEAGRIVWSVLGTELRSETRRGRYTQAAGRARPLADWGTPSRLVRRAETRKECATLIDSAPPPVKALIVDRYFEAKPQGCKSIAKAHEKSPASLDKSCQRTVRDFARKNPNLQLDSRSSGGGRHP
jgi:hypothetical protein